MSQLRVESLHADFGARVTGVDLTGPLADDVVEEIRHAIDTYSLLCFPEQPMTDEAHLALTRRLGEPETEHVTFGRTGEVVFFGTVGNVIDERTKRGSADPRTRYQTGSERPERRTSTRTSGRSATR